MANNKYVNKVVYGNTPLIDLTQTTVTADDVLNGKLVHLASGKQVEGNGGCTVQVIGTLAKLILPSSMAYVDNGRLVFGTRS